MVSGASFALLLGSCFESAGAQGEFMATAAKSRKPAQGRRLIEQAAYASNKTNTGSVTGIIFPYNSDYPFDVDARYNGEKPFAFAADAHITQHCAGMDDADLFNLRAAALGNFAPLRDTNSLDTSPRDGPDVLTRAEYLLDDYSSMYIHKVGEWFGPTDIGNYLSIPHPAVSGVGDAAVFDATLRIVDLDTYDMFYVRQEKWAHLDPDRDINNLEGENVTWSQRFQFYPCSVVLKKWATRLPPFTLSTFAEAGQQNYSIPEYCERMATSCTGEHQQFLDYDDCVAYATSLPHVDPICQDKYNSDYTAQGQAFLCKWLHHFMASPDSSDHCYHAGKGLSDSNGKRKCTPRDCLSDTTPADITPTFLADTNVAPAIYEVDADMNVVETLADDTKVPADTLTAIAARAAVVADVGACGEEEEDELVQSTIYASIACLPDLSRQGTVSDNCTQAVGTFLGRYAMNGAICRCHTSNTVSGTNIDYVVRRSALLTEMDIDPETLLLRAVSKLRFPLPTCLSTSNPETAHVPTCALGEYQIRHGRCKQWRFESLREVIPKEWDALANNLQTRITSSDLVAEAECNMLAAMDPWYLDGFFSGLKEMERMAPDQADEDNVIQQLVVETDMFASSDELAVGTFVHPEMGTPLITDYESLLQVYRTPIQVRGTTGRKVSPCTYGGTPILDTGKMIMTTKTTYSEQHVASRKFAAALFPGLSPPFDIPAITEFVKSEMERKYWDGTEQGKDLKKFIFSCAVKWAIGPLAFNVPDEIWGERAESYYGQIASLFRSHSYNRVHQQTKSTALASAKALLTRMFKEIIPLDVMRGHVLETGWWAARMSQTDWPERIIPDEDGDLTTVSDHELDFAYNSLAEDLIAVDGVARLGEKVINYVRKNECNVAHFWDENPTNFILEYARLEPPIIGFFIKNPIALEDTYQIIFSLANVNTSIYGDTPREFNPRRENLAKALIFNALESDAQAGYWSEDHVTNFATTLHRVCAGRGLTLAFLEALAPQFFPKNYGQNCANGVRVKSGVEFTKTYLNAGWEGDAPAEPKNIMSAAGNRAVDRNASIPNPVTVEVLTTAPLDTTQATRLFILLGDTYEPSVAWAPTIAKLQEKLDDKTDYWAMTLPGMGEGSRLRSCDMFQSAEYIVNIMRDVKDEPYTEIFVVGRGLGGLLSWYVAFVADDEKLLKGVITSAPHPAVYLEHFSKVPMADFYAESMVNPVVGELYIGKDNFERLEEAYFDSDGLNWDSEDYKDISKEEWKADHGLFWRLSGPSALTCYWRDNFYEDAAGKVMMTHPDIALAINPVNAHIQTFGFEFDPIHNPLMVAKSFLRLQTAKGHIMNFQFMKNTTHRVNQFFDDHFLSRYTTYIAKFATQTRQIKLSLSQFFDDPTEPGHSFWYAKAEDNNEYIFAACVFAALMGLAGVQLERLLGPIVMRHFTSKPAYLYCKIFSSVVFLSSLAVRSPVLVPLVVLAVFDFGHPVCVSSITRPFRSVWLGVRPWNVWRSFFDGCATVVHHTGGFIACGAVISHLSPPLPFLIAGLPILIEHILSSFDIWVMYDSALWHVFSMLLFASLETWLWLEIYYLQYVVDIVGFTGACCILSAHVVWCSGAFLSLGFVVFEDESDETELKVLKKLQAGGKRGARQWAVHETQAETEYNVMLEWMQMTEKDERKEEDQRMADRALLAGETWKKRVVRREKLKGANASKKLSTHGAWGQLQGNILGPKSLHAVLKES